MVGSFLVLITGFVSLFCGDFSAVVSVVGIVIFVVTIAVLPTIYAYIVKANMNNGKYYLYIYKLLQKIILRVKML